MYEDQFTQLQARKAFRYLKRGVCPPENICFFTVGLVNEVNLIKGTLESISSGAIQGKSYFLEAPYGYGKSHLLKFIESIALEQNFAVTQITHDGYDRAFNHPPRYIHYLYESLSVPGLSMRGLGNMVPHLLRGPQRNSLLHWANTPRVRWEIGYYIRQMENTSDSADSFYLKRFINCCDIKHRSGTYYSHLLYEKLNTLADLCRAIDLRGLVVLFDEVESIATLLPSIISRFRSYGILDRLTNSREFPHCCFYFAITEAFGHKIEKRDYAYGYRYYKDYYCDGCKFMGAWIKNKPNLLPIPKINKADKRDLCHKLTGLHEYAYSWSANDRISPTFIESYIDEVERHSLGTRDIIRSFVNILDTCQQYPHCDPSQELGLFRDSKEPKYFFDMAHWAKENDKLKFWERKLLYTIGMYVSKGWKITEKMECQAIRIIEICEDAGFSDIRSRTTSSKLIEDVLNTLTPREQDIIKMRFGIKDNVCHSLRAIGKEFNVTGQRIQQIEQKYLRKLRHPSRSRKLRSILEQGHILEKGYENLLRAIFGEKWI